MNNVLIAVGGTGGHLFPAQALAESLRQTDQDINIMFIGGGLEGNRFFQPRNYPYKDVPSSTLTLKKPFSVLSSCGKIVKGFFSSLKAIRAFKPGVIVGFGSFHSFPPLLAAKFLRIPMILYAGDSMPGRVIRFFSKKAEVTGIAYLDAAKYLQGKTLKVDFPIRLGYSTSFSSKHEARDYFHLDPEKFTFLVFGGSQGALTLNTHFCSAIMEMAERSNNFQVIHMTGSDSATKTIKELYDQLKVTASVKTFEENMEQAWLAADLVVGRAGASSLAEQLAMEVPGIVVPYPYATDQHQDKNADHMVNVVKGCLKISEKELGSQTLVTAISKLIENDRSKLKMLRKNLASFKQTSRSRDLTSVVCEVSGIKVR